ncbi:MAG: methyltransferase domain-containing protein [Sedimentisphaerales bacterium]|nr:methyltransferase domain-containing protein [Sedimentisphaerales bacterium]
MFSSFRRSLKRRLSFLKRRLRRPAVPQNEDGKVLLHIGCGPVNSPEFINIDALPYAHVHVITENIDDLPDFADETVDLVYMCHVLEHVRRPEVLRVLKEMKRVLKSDGVLRLSVPDFDRLIEVYKAGGEDVDVIRNQLMGGQDSEYNIHYSIFNHKGLSNLLREVGFREVRTWSPADSPYHDFKDRASRVLKAGAQSFAISLNLEAIK